MKTFMARHKEQILRGSFAPVLATCGAVFMTGLDNLIVTIALPSIQKSMHADIESLTWAVNAYTLTYGAFMLAASLLGDTFGRLKIYKIGLFFFVAGSLLACIQQNIVLFSVARAIQGIGAAVLTPLSLTLLIDHVSPERRRSAMIGWGSIAALATAVGPLIGGLVVAFVDWRWIFLVNVPIGLILLPLSDRCLKQSASLPDATLDVVSLLALTSGLFCVIFGMMDGSSAGWRRWSSTGSIVLGGVLIALFFGRDRKVLSPLVPRELFQSQGFKFSCLTGFFVCAGMYGVVFFLSQYLQVVLKYQPLDAGLSIMPWTLLPIFSAPIAARDAKKVGLKRVVAIGAFLQTVALIWFLIVIDRNVSYAWLLPGMVMAGVGMGVFFALIAAQSLSFVESGLHGVASGVANAVRQIGIVIGIAAVTTVFSAFGGSTDSVEFDAGIRPALMLSILFLSFSFVTALATPRE